MLRELHDYERGQQNSHQLLLQGTQSGTTQFKIISRNIMLEAGVIRSEGTLDSKVSNVVKQVTGSTSNLQYTKWRGDRKTSKPLVLSTPMGVTSRGTSDAM